MRNIIFTTLTLLLFSISLFAQQESHYTHFMYNTLSINPGYAGAKGTASAMALYRRQWIGFEGAPESKLVSFHAPIFGDRVGFGLTIENDQLGISDSWTGSMAYAYRIQLENDATVQIGFQGSIRYLGLDFENQPVLHSNDPSILENSLSQQYLGNFGVGLYMNYQQFYFGASVPRLFPNDIGLDITSTIGATETPHIYVMAGGLIPLSQTLSFKPAALAKIVKNAPFDLDLNASLVINNQFITGISYRIGGDGAGDSIDFLLHYRINNIGLGLAYDYTLSELTDYNKGSIEAIVVYDFVKERMDMANPRFFF